MEGRRRRNLDELGCCASRRLKYRLTSPGHRTASLEDLPEDLLHKVISGLTVKEAGRTSVLSSQWRKRWTYHANLCFDGISSELAGYDKDRFVHHVTTVLQQHSRMVVERFELRSPVLEKEHAHHLDGWFGFVTSTKARHVTLDFSPLINSMHRSVASPIKYSNQLNVDNGSSSSSCWTVGGIVSLLLGYVCLELPPVSDGLGFKTLKKLELKFVVDLGGLTPLIANCPALECLSISNSSIPHLVVPHQAGCLRYLRLERAGLQSIHLNATSLTTFDYLGSASVRIKTNNALKLSQAKILFPWRLDTVGYFWDELSCWLAPVHHLVLAFSMDTKTTRSINNPTKFIHLRHLVLFCNIFGDPESALVVLRLTQILDSAPQLEHFVLHMDSFDMRPLYLKTPHCIHPHAHHHLKTVQMTGVLGLSGQLELAKYILLSAEALESMTLNLARNRVLQLLKSDYTYFTELERFAKKYLDPQGVYHCVLKIVGLNSTCH